MPGEIVVPTPGSVLQGPVLSNFQPHSHLIENVTVAERAIVTTTDAYGWQEGTIVRIFVPLAYGMSLNVHTPISIIDDTSFLTTTNTLDQAPFVEPTFIPNIADGFTQAQAILVTGTVANVAGQT